MSYYRTTRTLISLRCHILCLHAASTHLKSARTSTFEVFLLVPLLFCGCLFLVFSLELQRMTFATCWTNYFATIFRLHRIARSSTTAMFIDLLLACYLANATCAVINIMTALIFIIVFWLHAFFLVVPVRSSLHVLVVVAVISYFQHSRDWSNL